MSKPLVIVVVLVAFGALGVRGSDQESAISPSAVKAAEQANQQEQPAAQEQAAADQRSGGSFGGAFAYDLDVGYDFGSFDDNGYDRTRYLNNRGRQKRMPGKRSDPGDVDLADFYYERHLRSGAGKSAADGAGPWFDFSGQMGGREYWRASRHIPLRYDDTWEFLHFRYELGAP